MKKIKNTTNLISVITLILIFTMLAFGCAPASAGGDETTEPAQTTAPSSITEDETTELPPPPQDFSVMTYNIAGYFGTSQDHKNAIVSAISTNAPDVAVINETTDALCKENAALSDVYGYIFPTVGDKKTDYMVLYKKDKFTALSDESYYLSPTPDVYSKVSGSYHYRTMTAVKLEHIQSGRQFYFIATHLENNSSNADVFQQRNNARKLQVKFMLNLINEKLDSSLPIIIAGDLNSSDRTDDKYRKGGISDILASGKFENCSSVAKNTSAEFTHVSGISLDHIIVSKGHFTVSQFRVDKSETPPSDHHPVIATVELK